MAHPPDALLLGFARALRAAGMPVTPDREAGYLDAVATVGMDGRTATYWAGRATLCSAPDEIESYDQVFTAWFSEDDSHVPGGPRLDQPVIRQASLADNHNGGSPEDIDEDPLPAVASATEVLRHRDVGELGASEKAALATLFAGLRSPAPRRRAHRHTAWHRGSVDAHRTLRRLLARMGEPGTIALRRRSTRPRRIVLLVDVSGSMSAYADSLLRLAHRWLQGDTRVEVFTMGTRLSHVTRALRQRDPDRALVAAGGVVPDWSGGTRLGETLKVFLARWGARGMARGAVVVIFSDGWERDGVDVLGEQMRRLQAVSHRVVWVNPHRGKVGYQPVQQGIVAALPFVDDFVAGHSLRTFEELAEMVTHA